jgi:hypothetical protein
MKKNILVVVAIVLIFTIGIAGNSFAAEQPKLIEVRNEEGETILNANEGNGYTYYAYEDGYDVNVAGGFLYMKAGYSYIFEMMPTMAQAQAEVRVTDTGESVGYVLLNSVYNSDGAFSGLEVPEAFVDVNGDGIIAMQEMNDALGALSDEVSSLKGTEAERLNASITAAAELVSQGQIADAYESAKQIKLDADAAAQSAAEQAGTTRSAILWICVAAAAVIVLVIVFILRKRKKKDAVLKTM